MKNTISLILITVLLFWSCGGHKGNNPTPVIPPSKPVLLFPASNEVCTQGTIQNDSLMSVTLKWQALNADSYSIAIKNLTDGTTTTQSSTGVNLTIILKRAQPYSWSVTALSTKTTATATSDVWKFFAAGSVVSYAPFPAEIAAPTPNQAVSATNGQVTLSWTGSDVDNDITGYDVYLSTTTAVKLLQSRLQHST